MKKITLNMIVNHIGLNYVVGNDKIASKITIKSRAINRGGLELSGFFHIKDKDKILIFGKKELAYIKEMTPNKIKVNFTKIFKNQIRAIIFTHKVKVPKSVKDIATECKAVILNSKFGYTDTGFQIAEYLNYNMSTTQQVHGTLVNIFGKGVLISGKSGVGKSETAIELLQKGHLFVVDDGTLVRRVGNALFGSSPKTIKNLIEVRGLGILDVSKLFGDSSIIDRQKIDYIFELKEYKSTNKFDRLGKKIKYKEILDIKIPQIQIPVSSGRTLSTLVEVAVSKMIMLEKKHNLLDKYDNYEKDDK